MMPGLLRQGIRMQTQSLRGFWCAVVTPIGAGGAIDHSALARHVRGLFDQGCDGVAVFGTTGEGQSFSVKERREAVDMLLAAGVPGSRIIVGTGCAALPDAIELTRHAVECDVAAAMLLPPFFWKNIGDAGVVASVRAVIDGVNDPRLAVILYHIPSVSAVSVEPDALAALADSHGSAIVGIKDSSADWDHFERGRRRMPGLRHFIGAETQFTRALDAGGAGTICGLGNIVPGLMARLRDARTAAERLAPQRELEALVACFDDRPFLPRLKAALAGLAHDAAWTRVRPPLIAIAPESARDIVAAVRAAEESVSAA
jgi:4-hydroxy-tetrahydrodipicolinate synthase